MIRLSSAIALLLAVFVSPASAVQITLRFEGTIQSVVDANAVGAPAINFTPIPVGSTFSGTYTYDSDSPLTNGGTGFKRYTELLSSGGSLNINGFEFLSTGAGFGIVASQEANFSYSGIAMGTQPIALPEGWGVARANLPYFTMRFEDETPQPRSLDLPASAEGFPTDNMILVVDFQQSVTIDGETFGGRVFINGQITSLSVTGPVPPPVEVEIDIDPATVSNSINLNTKNPKPLHVAVFGSPGFDVTSVVPGSIELGDAVLTDPETGTGDKVAPSNIQILDVDGDGIGDLLLTFNLTTLQNFGAIDRSSTALSLNAWLTNQGTVFGSDSISILGGKGKGKK